MRVASISYLNIRQRSPGMMTESADHVTGIAVVIGMASEGRVKAEFAALLGRRHILVHRVDRLQYAPRDLLELAQLHRLVNTMVLEVVDAFGEL